MVKASEIPSQGRALFGVDSLGEYRPVRVDAAGNLMSNPAAALTPLGYGQIAATAAVKGLADAIAIPAGATLAIVEPEGAAARYRDDGTNPTAAIGMRIADGGRLVFGGDLTLLKFIAQAGTAIYNVSFYK